MATIKTKCKDPPACEGAPHWLRKQQRRNPAAAKPFQLSWRVLGVEKFRDQSERGRFNVPSNEATVDVSAAAWKGSLSPEDLKDKFPKLKFG